MDSLWVLLATAGLNFMTGVPGADDLKLNHQSTSFHDALLVHQLLGLKRAPEFEAWLKRQQLAHGRLAALCGRSCAGAGRGASAAGCGGTRG